MSFTKDIFNKTLYELTTSDIVNFFAVEQEETSTLEFKSGKVELEEIYREVSAFLNTEGGILIIGAPKEQKIQVGNKEKKVCKGELTVSKFTSQDNLLRSISSNISPSPYSIKIKELGYSTGNIFILEIAQSLTPPHQVNSEGRYYIRLEREAKSAPHGIVEALFFKRQKPDLDVTFEVSTLKKDPTLFEIVFKFSNNSVTTAENIGFICQLDGVQEIVESVNVIKDNVLKDGHIYYQDSYIDSILLKCISTPVSFTVRLINDSFLMECAFWCRDVQAEHKLGYFDSVNGFEFKRWYNSKSSENELTPVEIYEEHISNKNAS